MDVLNKSVFPSLRSAKPDLLPVRSETSVWLPFSHGVL
jgi:hypothetical protein